MSKLNRWMRSKTGKYTIAGGLVVFLLFVVAGQTFGWWQALGLTGTAGLPATMPYVEYPDPQLGYTCLPSCSETDGKFLLISNKGMDTFAGERVNVWIAVPSNKTSFELGIFDGDSGKDNNQELNWSKGNWDDTNTESTYTLYADPLKDGTGLTIVTSWRGNTDPMLNNDWFTQIIDNVEAAKGPSQHYFYRLEISQEIESLGSNAFKLRSSGYLSAGNNNIVDTHIGITGGLSTMNDVQILYPDNQGLTNLGPSTYTGDWQLYFYIPNDTTMLSLWDGDFDRGNGPAELLDDDDPNTIGKPEWASSYAVDERAGNIGSPPDDLAYPIYRREPAVFYTFTDPEGMPVYENNNPSGTEEWEHFVVSTDPSIEADLYTDYIKAGFYTLHIEGLDLHNFVWVRLDYELVPATCDGPCVPPPVWPEGTCPRTIGYWKNNVQKVLIEGKTGGVQETVETLQWGLDNIAMASPLFRSGIDVNAPYEIGDKVPLTWDEANMILQRDASYYPGDSESMMARALQQNLATWLNLGTGKLGPTTVISLDWGAGTFNGTVWEALQEAQNIILYGGDLERAKDIADQINNGLLGEDAGDSVCEDYVNVIPPESQPPTLDEMPKAPLPPEVPPVDPGPPTCSMPGYDLAQGYAIVALNPDGCQGNQNGLKFHGNADTIIRGGGAFSNGCLRSVGTHSVIAENGVVNWVGESFGDMSLIVPEPFQVSDPAPEYYTAPPDCSHPDAHQINGKDWKGDIHLDPGLYCVTGGLDIKANSSFTGEGVTIYVLDGGITINGNSSVQLGAPFLLQEQVEPALSGILFYVEGSQTVKINGNEVSKFDGVIYAPDSDIAFLGTGETFASRSQLIGWNVEVGGTAYLTIDWIWSSMEACIE